MKSEYDKLRNWVEEFETITSIINKGEPLSHGQKQKAEHIKDQVEDELEKLKGIIDQRLAQRIRDVSNVICEEGGNSSQLLEQLLKDMI